MAPDLGLRIPVPTCADDCRATCTASARPTLLIAEDDALARGVFARAAEREGFAVRPVASVAEALAVARAEHLDLALLDVRLPEGSGLQLAEALHAAGDVPFLFLTAHADASTVERATQLGALGFLLKPLDPAALGPMLRTACARGAERRQSGDSRWLAAELHDGLGQHLAGLSFLAASLVGRAQVGEPALAQLRTLQELLHEAQEDCRALAHARYEGVHDLQASGAALQRLARRITRLPGIVCRFEQSGAPRRRLPAATARHLYLIAQEAVANAIRHGGARRISIRLDWCARGFVLSVRDDGGGLGRGRTTGEGLGLTTMRARAGALGGTLALRSLRPRGVEVRATVRLSPRRRPASRR